MPLPGVHAMAIIKKCCAKYNKQSGRLKSELADAIREYVSGQRISVPRTDSIGCSVKWKN